MGGVGLVPAVFFLFRSHGLWVVWDWCIKFFVSEQEPRLLVVWDWYLHFFSTFFCTGATACGLCGIGTFSLPGAGHCSSCPEGWSSFAAKKNQKKKSVPQYNYSIEAIMEGTFEGGGEMDASLFTMYPEGWW